MRRYASATGRGVRVSGILVYAVLGAWGCSGGDSREASAGASASPVAGAQALPKFEDYPSGEIYRGRIAPVDLDGFTGPAPLRRAISNAAAGGGVNFAGSFLAVPAECGINCFDLAVVDARTGEVHHVLSGTTPISYRADSDLLIVEAPQAPPGEPRCAGCTAAYYVWRGDRLEKIPEESWVGAPVPESVRRALHEYRPEEAALLARDARSVTRPVPDRLVVEAQDGTVRLFEDDFIADEVLRFYRYRGDAVPVPAYVIERVYIPEGGQFFLVDARDGRITEIDDMPVPAPDGTRFLTSSIDLVAGHRPNRARVYALGPRGPAVEWEIAPQEWGLADLTWIDDRTIAFTRVELDTETTPFAERRSAGRLILREGRWSLR